MNIKVMVQSDSRDRHCEAKRTGKLAASTLTRSNSVEWSAGAEK
jgi:hypothetical protein